MSEMAPFNPSAPTTNMMQQSPVAATGPVLVFTGWGKTDTLGAAKPGVWGGGFTEGDFEVSKERSPKFLTAEQFLNRFDEQDREDFLRMRNLMIAAGVLSPTSADPYSVRTALETVLGKVATMNQAGTMITPFAWLSNLAAMNGFDPDSIGAEENFDPAAALAGGGDEPFTGTKTQISRTVNDLTDGQAWAVLRNNLQSMLGRDPSDQEMRDFAYKMNQAAARNPTITKTIAEYEEGELMSTTSKTRGGFTMDDANMAAYEQAQNDDEYAEYQASTVYFNALLSALGPIGG